MLELLIIILGSLVLYISIKDIITFIREYKNNKDDDDDFPPTPHDGVLIRPV